MTQKKSSNPVPVVEDKKEDIEVKIEGEDSVAAASPGEVSPTPAQEPVEDKEEDILTLKKQLEELQNAQEGFRAREREANVMAQQAAAQLNSFRHTAEQSQYEALVTAMGAAEMEVASAKQDIVLAGNAQDYEALADAQERLSAAKTRMISLEMGKDNYERAVQAPQRHQPQADPIESNPNLTYEEKAWLRSHPEAMTDQRQYTRLNAAYFDAVERGLQRGSKEYFGFIEERLGYAKPSSGDSGSPREDSPVMVAAPPSRSVPAGSGPKTSFTITKEEAEIAKASGITPAEYVKQKVHLQELKKQGHYNNQ